MVEPNKSVLVEKKLVGKYIFSLSERLGIGAYGAVYRGCLKADPSKEVAIKMVPISINEEEFEQMKVLLEREVDVMQNLDHPSILKLIDIVMTPKNLYLVTELCNEGDLEGRKKDLTVGEALLVVKQIAEAMSYANKVEKVIHRDLKPANILIHNGQVKIADFGFARTVDDPKIQSRFTKKIGTPLYMSPQVNGGEKYGPKCDVWSLGILLYELLFKQPPWYGINAFDLFKNIKEQTLNLVPEKDTQLFKEFDKDIQDLLTFMLKKTERNRFDFEQVLAHAAFKRELPKELNKKKVKAP